MARNHRHSEPQPCGTVGAYSRHRRNGERPCEACRAAVRAYNREYEQRRRELPPAPPVEVPTTWDEVLDHPAHLLAVLDRIEADRTEAA
jgi:hypothetical protein